jgi:hypothetical protein
MMVEWERTERPRRVAGLIHEREESNMNAEVAKEMQAELKVAAEAVASQFGLKLRQASGTVSEQFGTVDLRFAFAGPDSDRLHYELVAPGYGLAPETFGQTFTNKDVSYVIEGCSRNGRRPIQAHKADSPDERFRFTAQSVIDGLVAEKPKPARKPRTSKKDAEEKVA